MIAPRPLSSVGDGLRTVFLPPTDGPLVAIRLVLAVGSADDPPGREGLAGLAAALLARGGSRRLGRDQRIAALYPMAAAIDVHVDKEAITLGGAVHRDHAATFADLLLDPLLEPAASDDDLELARRGALARLARLRGSDDEALGKQALAALLYRGHPYGHPCDGTDAGLAAITRADLDAFRAAHLTANRVIVGLAGGYSPGLARRLVDRLAALPPAGPPRAPLPAPPARGSPSVLLIARDAPATAISLGHPIQVTRADDDFYPLTVARSYLGEHRSFHGLLLKKLRGARGMNYGDYAYVEAFAQDGATTFPRPNLPRALQHFEVWLRPVRPDNALFALRLARREIDALCRDGIPERDFEETRRFLLHHVHLWTQDASRRLGYAIDGRIYGRDIVAELSARLPRMTRAEVGAAVLRHLSTDGWAAALVTPRAEADGRLLREASSTPRVQDGPAPPTEILAEDREIARFSLAIDPASIEIQPAGSLFER